MPSLIWKAFFLAQIKNHPRIPATFGGVQVNHCKNVHCANFGVVAPESRGASGVKPDKVGAYTVIGSEERHRILSCQICKRSTTMRSNVAIVQELARFEPSKMRKESACCPVESCEAFGLNVSVSPEAYHRHGHTKAGVVRYRCKKCGATFSTGAPIRTQRRPEMTDQVLNC